MQLGHFTPNMYESGKDDNTMNFSSAKRIGCPGTSNSLIVIWSSNIKPSQSYLPIQLGCEILEVRIKKGLRAV